MSDFLQEERYRRALREFGLNQATNLRPLFRGTSGEKIHFTADGRGFLLRVLPPPRPLYFDFALRCQQITAEQLQLAPRLMASERGELWIMYDDFCFTVEEYIDGDSREIGISEAQACGRAVGLMHRVLAPMAQLEDGIRAWYFLAGLAYGHTSSLQGSHTRIEHAPEFNFIAKWRAALDKISSALPELPLPCGCHGDINPTNILWRGVNPCLCDFANASKLPQVVDLTMAMIGVGLLSWDLSTKLELVPERISPKIEILRSFLRAYNGVRPITPEERALLPHMLVVSARYNRTYVPAVRTRLHEKSSGHYPE